MRWGTFTCDIPLLLVISMDFGLGVQIFILSVFIYRVWHV